MSSRILWESIYLSLYFDDAKMIETILSRVKEEIGIDGTNGSSIEKVWEYVESITKEITKLSGTTIEPKIDDRYKSFLWNYIKAEPELTFYVLKSTADPADNDVEQLLETTVVAESNEDLLDDIIPDKILSPVKHETMTYVDLEDPEQITEESQASNSKSNAKPKAKSKAKPKAKAKTKEKGKKKAKAKASFQLLDSGDEFVPDDEVEDSEVSDFDESNEVSEDEEFEDETEAKKQFTQKMAPLKKSHPNYTSTDSAVEAQLEFDPIENLRDFSYEKLIEVYGNKIYVVGSEKLQNEQLYIGLTHGVSLSHNLHIVLKEIVRHRARGIYQATITKRLNIDARSTGHYVKSLEEKGAIVRRGVSINGMFTNICVHTRFSNEKHHIDMSTVGDDLELDQLPYNVNNQGKAFSQRDVLDALVELTKDMPNNAILSRDALLSMGFFNVIKSNRKWFNRSIDELSLKGYLKKTNVQTSESGKLRGIHILKVPEDTPGAPPVNIEEEINLPIRIKSTRLDTPIAHMLVDVPMESQVFDVLVASGTNGVTLRDINFALNMNELRALQKYLDRLVEVKEGRFKVIKVLEFEGRIKRYRYYTEAAFMKKTEGVDIELPPLSSSGLDETKHFERNIFQETPHDLKPFKKYLKLMKESGGKNINIKEAMENPKAKKTTKKLGRPRKNPIAVPAKRDASSQDTETPAKKPRTKITAPPTLQITRGRTSQPATINLTEDDNPENPESAASTSSNEIARNVIESPVVAPSLESASTSNPVTANIPVASKIVTAKTPSKSPAKTPSKSPAKTTARPKNKITDFFTSKPRSSTNTTTSVEPETIEIPDSPKSAPDASVESSTGSLNDVVMTESDADSTPKIREQEVVVQISPKIIVDSPALPTSESPTENKTNENTATESTATSDEASKDNPTENSPTLPESTENDNNVASSQETNNVVATTESSSVSTARNQKGITESGISKVRHIKTVHNPYLENRIKVILCLLENEPIIELGKEFRRIYIEKAEEFDFKSKSEVCNKTLWRTALEMKKRAVAQIDIVECPLINGRRMSRKLLIRKDVDLEGVQYRNYVSYLKECRAMQIIRFSFKTLETVDSDTILSMDARIERMKQNLEDLKAQGKDDAAAELDSRIKELSINWQKVSEKNRKTSGGWMIRAIQLGWVNATMIRCKLIHNHLFSLFSGDAVDVDKESRIINVKNIILYMPLHLVCQTLNAIRYSDEVASFVHDPKNASQLLKDLPPTAKQSIINRQSNFRKSVYNLLKVLEFLGLVEPLYSGYQGDGERNGGYAFLAPNYKVFKNVAVRDYKRIDFPILREYTLEDASDLALYWSELQYVCSINDGNIPENERSSLNEVPELKTLLTPKNWSVRSVFTRAQKKILNSYVDRINHKTPIGKPVILRSIAEAVGIDVEDVKSYYQKVQDALERKFEHNERKRTERMLTPRRMRQKRSEYYDKRVINLSSTRLFKRIKKSVPILKELEIPDDDVAHAEQEKRAISQKRARGEQLYLDDFTDIPTIRQSSDTDLRRTRTKRHHWTSQEDELLIYAVIVLRQRSSARFLWAAIRQIFPDKTPNVCRNRLIKLMQQPIYVEQMEMHTFLWRQYYEEGIQNGDIEDPDPQENINFDLLGYVMYFIRRLTERNTRSGYFVFPDSLEQLRARHSVKQNSARTYHYEDLYHDKATMVSRQQALYSQAFTIRRHDGMQYDQSKNLIQKENEKEYRLIRLIQAYCMMCLMTPIELFDQFYSYNVIQTFPKDVFQKSIDMMTDDGTLIRSRGARPVPGVKRSLSAKFLETMAGELPPEMLKQAKEYTKFLETQETKIRYNPAYISSGMMACLLNLISDHKLSISFANLDSHLNKVVNSSLQGRKIDASLLYFELDIQKKSDEDQFMPYVPKPDEVFLRELTENELKKAFNDLIENEDEYFADIIRKVLDTMYEGADEGCTLYQLKSKLGDSVTDEEIIRAVHKLCFNDPGLACRVGSEAVRYVHISFIDDWSISTDPAKYSTIKKLLIKSRDMENDKRKPIIIPSLWTDVNGGTTDLILKGCKEAIVDIVIRKPGITEANIQRHLKKALSRREVRDLLTILVEQQVLRQVQMSIAIETTKNRSIFGKTKLAKVLNNNTIQETTQTCFWPTSNVYTIAEE